jgi:hypothetical protein
MRCVSAGCPRGQRLQQGFVGLSGSMGQVRPVNCMR